jgi:hypothetical protein
MPRLAASTLIHGTCLNRSRPRVRAGGQKFQPPSLPLPQFAEQKPGRRRSQPERRAEGQWDPGENCCRMQEVLDG